MNDSTGLDQDDESDQVVTGIFHIVKLLFHSHYCAQYEITPPDKGRVTLTAFCRWLEETLSTFAGEELCEQVAADLRSWNTLVDLVETRHLASRLQQLWYSVTLADRPPVAPGIRSINSAVIITYQDGTVCNMQAYATPETCPPMVKAADGQDGFVANMLAEHGRQLGQIVAEQSLQMIHTQSKTLVFVAPAGLQDPYEVFCGGILRLLPMIQPGLRAGVENYLRLFQTLVRPPIPPEVLAKYRQQVEEIHSVRPSDEIRGGFG